MADNERGNVALIILGVLLALGGGVALFLVLTDAMNPAEVGTAKKLAGAGLGIGALALFGGIAMRKK